MAANQPEVDIANAIATALGAGYAVGTQIKYGAPRSPVEPGNELAVIWVLATGGPGPQPLLSAATLGSYRDASIQVRVRSAPEDQAGGLALARAVRDALHCQPITASAGAPYIRCTVDHSEPVYLGMIEELNGMHDWSLNFSLEWIS